MEHFATELMTLSRINKILKNISPKDRRFHQSFAWMGADVFLTTRSGTWIPKIQRISVTVIIIGMSKPNKAFYTFAFIGTDRSNFINRDYSTRNVFPMTLNDHHHALSSWPHSPWSVKNYWANIWSSFSAATVSQLNKIVNRDVKAFRERSVKAKYMVIYCDATYLNLRQESVKKEALHV